MELYYHVANLSSHFFPPSYIHSFKDSLITYETTNCFLLSTRFREAGGGDSKPNKQTLCHVAHNQVDKLCS